jgi:hypothetical protein
MDRDAGVLVQEFSPAIPARNRLARSVSALGTGLEAILLDRLTRFIGHLRACERRLAYGGPRGMKAG